MPGAELGVLLDDGAHAVTVKVKLGPMKFAYDGTVRISEQDPAARRAVLLGAAREARGQGSAEAAITMQVAPQGDGSHVTATAQIDLSGRAAQMGHGVVESVSKQLIGQMTRCLETRFVAPREAEPAPAPPRPAEAAPEATPLRAGALMRAVVWERLKALLRIGRKR
jgi:carbon monoxide dehydrogenase subunit G